MVSVSVLASPSVTDVQGVGIVSLLYGCADAFERADAVGPSCGV